MDLDKAVEKRINVKNYTSKKPPIEKIIDAIDSANHTPGPGNLDVLSFVIVEDPEKISEIARECQQNFINKAPYVIVISSNPKQLKKLYDENTDKYLKHYLGALVQTLSLKLCDIGLSSCWIEVFPEKIIKGLLSIPENHEIELILTVGYEMGKARRKIKPALINKVFFGGYGEKFHKPLIKIRRGNI